MYMIIAANSATPPTIAPNIIPVTAPPERPPLSPDFSFEDEIDWELRGAVELVEEELLLLEGRAEAVV